MSKVFINCGIVVYKDKEISRVHVLPYMALFFGIILSWAERTTKARKCLLAMKAVASRGVSQMTVLILYQTTVAH